MLELTVVSEIGVEILRRSESVPDLLQLARLGHVSLEDVLCHLFLTIFNNLISRREIPYPFCTRIEMKNAISHQPFAIGF